MTRLADDKLTKEKTKELLSAVGTETLSASVSSSFLSWLIILRISFFIFVEKLKTHIASYFVSIASYECYSKLN